MQTTYNLPKINIVSLRKFILKVFAICFIFSAGYFVGQKGFRIQKLGLSGIKIDRSLPANRADVNFGLFWNVWDTLESRYFDKTKLDPGNMVFGAIKGMVASIGDPYTVFLPPEENKLVQEDLQGNFQGVGIQIGFKGTQLTVIAPLANTPAERAGIKAGDYIIGIKDEKKGIDMGTVGISLPDAVAAIRGPAGSEVTLALLREGAAEPILTTITREDIIVPSVSVSYQGEAKQIADIALLKFGGDTQAEWDNAVSEVLKSDAKAIVLDLRNNPGGYLQGAVDIAGDFLDSQTIVVSEESSDGNKEDLKTDRLPRLAKYPLVVLVNKGSASASEILAGALSDQAGVKIVGETTFGKGTIQEPLELASGSGIHITVAKWLTPKGTWINDKGIEPDVKVEDDLSTSDDEQLNKAIEVLGI
jgi:carboxyl-terminal processing protease